MMHKIHQHLADYTCFFTPYYADGLVAFLARKNLLNNTVLGGQAKEQTEKFLRQKALSIDYKGALQGYDLVVSCSDLIVPKNIRETNIILVQEGMTDPENLKYHIVKGLGLPRFIGNTSMTGLSHSYREFCVASEGFRELFIRKGIAGEKIRVTGIPNFDDVRQFQHNDFPHHGYVLAATSCLRETLKYENRKKFIRKALAIAGGRQVIFKLHPNENAVRAAREINEHAPGSLIFADGNTNHMVANCAELVTKYSSVLLIALAMGKPVHADIDEQSLRSLRPVQNGGSSAARIAEICKQYLN